MYGVILKYMKWKMGDITFYLNDLQTELKLYSLFFLPALNLWPHQLHSSPTYHQQRGLVITGGPWRHSAAAEASLPCKHSRGFVNRLFQLFTFSPMNFENIRCSVKLKSPFIIFRYWAFEIKTVFFYGMTILVYNNISI